MKMSMKMNAEFVPEKLQAFFREHPKLALAFSGGCDSAYLLYAATVCGAEILLCCVQSCFQPEFELHDAQKLAAELGQTLHLLPVDVLADENVRSNPPNRCYFCKRGIFTAILSCAKAKGFDCVIDGTNASDDADDRPGMKALGEMQVLSPLRMCGITKKQLRELSRKAGVFLWNKPAYACLATRIPTGMEIRLSDLAKVERAEKSLMEMGFSDFRVRLSGDCARLELTQAQMPLLLLRRQEALELLEKDFREVYLNLRPRKGLDV